MVYGNSRWRAVLYVGGQSSTGRSDRCSKDNARRLSLDFISGQLPIIQCSGAPRSATRARQDPNKWRRGQPGLHRQGRLSGIPGARHGARRGAVPTQVTHIWRWRLEAASSWRHPRGLFIFPVDDGSVPSVDLQAALALASCSASCSLLEYVVWGGLCHPSCITKCLNRQVFGQSLKNDTNSVIVVWDDHTDSSDPTQCPFLVSST